MIDGHEGGGFDFNLLNNNKLCDRGNLGSASALLGPSVLPSMAVLDGAASIPAAFFIQEQGFVHSFHQGTHFAVGQVVLPSRSLLWTCLETATLARVVRRQEFVLGPG
jgi:hypothetical protein